jgi:hypothetical protein
MDKDREPLVEDFWFKVVDFLQTNWAIVERVKEGISVIFIQDASGVFDQLNLIDRHEAERQLRLNGFRHFVEEQRAQEFLKPPSPLQREAASERPDLLIWTFLASKVSVAGRISGQSGTT